MYSGSWVWLYLQKMRSLYFGTDSCVNLFLLLCIINFIISPSEMQEGKRLAIKPTLFYLMHCGKALYNNLLWKNWSPNCLPLVVIIGNSFNGMRERFVQDLLDWKSFNVIFIRIFFLVRTGWSKENSSGTTATSTRLWLYVRRDNWPVHLIWLTSFVTPHS